MTPASIKKEGVFQEKQLIYYSTPCLIFQVNYLSSVRFYEELLILNALNALLIQWESYTSAQKVCWTLLVRLFCNARPELQYQVFDCAIYILWCNDNPMQLALPMTSKACRIRNSKKVRTRDIIYANDFFVSLQYFIFARGVAPSR